ncbi:MULTISPECIES: acyltransferase family protein [Mycobacteriaceae]|uniref:Acyltransferase n=1 Tax=Mycolicibacterium neoaurum VKM Ac-1815D TaxID=700508 RepID=V5XED3_MYCNE|nr:MULTISPECIES: acyltransferase [Mycobacteriaceae]AHC26800.1 acyltransferase [Mycolicibacterium neoaurum VKM Ac-1815D]AMO07102.1 acyltransferase [Mycolicibacterium neoaurum]AXK74524.1 acyltransferase [Mycolicibacterium neoaurum]KJQ50179.1 acyltransferase [Mycolicibacterium neoaurum]KUM06786.1 acyltransferase [Mycolicibacterium neoaurum]
MTSQRDAQGGLESVSATGRVDALTGVRAVAALLVVLTHAAYTTGKYPQGFTGSFWSRAEIGVPIFFVLSGFLLFRPWVRASAAGLPSPSVRRYAWHRVRRIMPAYVVTVLVAYAVYHFREAGPNPGHTWEGLLRNLTLTQIYTDNYLYSYLHQGMTQMWSLAVEVAFYLVLPVLAWLLLVVLCRRRWRPGLLLTGLGVLFAISPAWLWLVHSTDFLPDAAPLWLPTYLAWFVGGMLLAVWEAAGVRAYAMLCLPLAVICYLIAATPLAGAPTTSPALLSEAVVKTVFYMAIATLVVAPLALTGSAPLALTGSALTGSAPGQTGWYYRAMASRPMVFLGEISYEIFLIHLILMELVMVEVLRFPIYTGSMWALFFGTMVATVPLAWLLHRLTRVRDRPSRN